MAILLGCIADDHTGATDLASTLVANGSAASPVILTDDDDDSAGGDTNGNGPSAGSRGSWYGLVFTSGEDALSAVEVVKVQHFNPDKATFHIGVHLARCFHRSGAAANRPRSHFILTSGQEADQIQQSVGRPYETVAGSLFQPKKRQKSN